MNNALLQQKNTLLDPLSSQPTVYTASQWVELLLVRALEKRASDIHFESHQEDWMNICLRIDGIIQTLDMPCITFVPQCIAHLKVLAGLDLHAKNCAQEGQFQYHLKAYSVPFTFRISIIPTVSGEKISLRYVEALSQNKFDLTALGLSTRLQESIHIALKRGSGFIGITGPTGSGKTRTLYALLQYLQAHGKLIYSIEDPIELNLSNITQIEVDPNSSFNFAYAFKKILRHDPDVIALGEIRDAATAQLAFQAAQTGHLVLASLHTQDALGAFLRLVEFGINIPVLARCASLIITQRLVRKLHGHGYCGRTGIFEGLLLPVTHENTLWQYNSLSEFLTAIQSYQIDSLVTDCQNKIAQKITDFREFKRLFPEVTI